ncbi:SLC13 family permease [Dermacoccus nishinomiyaensis]|uniref:SLC13 family permease n=1 Tax=Dermacoccus nishinomiyaensis TaxID=1274 RepID=UPI00248D6F4F|nr:SLC13 family permease [Dermacoccus nishinomiyaensis]
MHEALDLLARVPGVLAFLLALTIVAECCSAAGVFDDLARRLVTVGRGHVPATWLLFLLTTGVVTALLGLDTTAVLMTSAAVVVARRLRAPVAMFAFPTLWLANMASLWLPVSNLTNLLAREHLGSTSSLGFLALAWPVALTTTLVPLLCAAVIWRPAFRSFDGHDRPGRRSPCTTAPDDTSASAPLPQQRSARRSVAVITLLMCAAILVVEPWMTAGVAALCCVLALALLTPERLREITLPWRSLLITTALFVAVAVLHGSGALDPLVRTLDDAPAWALTLSGAGLANATNNLPAYLALEPAAHDATRVLALLIGVNVASGLTWWGSVATLLWRERLRREGVTVSWRRHLLLTGSTTFITTAAALAVLALTR